MEEKFSIIDGPDKPALRWALAYPERDEVHFKFEGDAADARVVHMEELPGGVLFTLRGTLTSGTQKGRTYEGQYNVETRSGSLTIV